MESSLEYKHLCSPFDLICFQGIIGKVEGLVEKANKLGNGISCSENVGS